RRDGRAPDGDAGSRRGAARRPAAGPLGLRRRPRAPRDARRHPDRPGVEPHRRGLRLGAAGCAGRRVPDEGRVQRGDAVPGARLTRAQSTILLTGACAALLVLNLALTFHTSRGTSDVETLFGIAGEGAGAVLGLWLRARRPDLRMGLVIV